MARSRNCCNSACSGFGLFLLVLGLLLGCGKGQGTKPPEPPAELRGCPAPKAAPTYCTLKDVPERYVVGVPPGHGWERGDRLELRGPGDERVAYAWVVEVYETAVKVTKIVQGRPVDLAGATVRKVGKDEALRLGKHFGRVLDLRGGRVRLDLGSEDGLVVGDSFVVLGPTWDAEDLGRLHVTELEALTAWAVVDLKRDNLYPGLGVQFVQAAVMGQTAQVTVLVVNFDADDSSPRTSSFGRSFAKQLAGDLDSAARGVPGWTVRYEETETVRRGVAEEAAHAQAKEIGLKHGADLVVWGSMRCDETACALPRYTSVRPERFGNVVGQGSEVWRGLDDSGLRNYQSAVEATALLGALTFAAQRYGDAAYYLRQAVVSASVLAGDDAGNTYQRLSYASFVVGQVEEARRAAQALAQFTDAFWQRRGEAELARIELHTGDVASARRRLTTLAAIEDDLAARSLALQMLAALEAQEGRVEESGRLLAKSLAFQRHNGDLRGEANSLNNLAILMAQQGDIDGARNLYIQALRIVQRIGDIQSEADSLHNIAMLDVSQGHVDEARNSLSRGLALYQRIGDTQGEATSLQALAMLEEQQGNLDVARSIFEQALTLYRGIRDIKGEAAALHQLANLVERTGMFDDALNLYTKSLELKRSIGDIQGEAASLHQVAVLEAARGNVAEARNLYTQSLKRSRQASDARGALVARLSIAILDLKDNQIARAQLEIQDIVSATRKHGFAELLANSLQWLGISFSMLRDIPSARASLEEAIDLYEKLHMNKQAQAIRSIMEREQLGR